MESVRIGLIELYCIWAFFILFWLASIIYDIAAGKFKMAMKWQSFMLTWAKELCIVIVVILIYIILGQYNVLGVRFIPNTILVIDTGLGIALIGVLFAIWARTHLGSNWSSNAVLKKGHMLIRTGPYAIVRHPIYTGITTGMIGSAIALGTVDMLIIIAAAFVISYSRISEEEKLLKDEFGKEYEEYSKEVKAFVPLIW